MSFLASSGPYRRTRKFCSAACIVWLIASFRVWPFQQTPVDPAVAIGFACIFFLLNALFAEVKK